LLDRQLISQEVGLLLVPEIVVGTEPRGVVGFEVILGAYASLLSMAATGSVSLVS
jgi:hypothetical protein